MAPGEEDGLIAVCAKIRQPRGATERGQDVGAFEESFVVWVVQVDRGFNDGRFAALGAGQLNLVAGFFEDEVGLGNFAQIIPSWLPCVPPASRGS